MYRIRLFSLISLFFAATHLFASNDIQLPNTDGGPLIAKLEAVSKQESKRVFEIGKKSCDNDCISKFGETLGEVDGAIAYSNCKSTCIKSEYSFMNLKTKQISIHSSDPNDDTLHYIGVIHQCVEYARKWWMINQGITFGSIDSAFEILYLTEGKNIYNNITFPLARSINGSAKKPPTRGDLIIYGADRNNPNWRHGHVAVVVNVDLTKGLVDIAEENYNNKPWLETKAYSRQLRLFKIGEYYRLLDISPDQIENVTGATISGWIYPLNRQL